MTLTFSSLTVAVSSSLETTYGPSIKGGHGEGGGDGEGGGGDGEGDGE